VEDASPSLSAGFGPSDSAASAPFRSREADPPALVRVPGPDRGGWEFFGRLLVWATRNNA